MDHTVFLMIIKLVLMTINNYVQTYLKVVHVFFSLKVQIIVFHKMDWAALIIWLAIALLLMD
jgi:hypothetical protein